MFASTLRYRRPHRAVHFFGTSPTRSTFSQVYAAIVVDSSSRRTRTSLKTGSTLQIFSNRGRPEVESEDGVRSNCGSSCTTPRRTTSRPASTSQTRAKSVRTPRFAVPARATLPPQCRRIELHLEGWNRRTLFTKTVRPLGQHLRIQQLAERESVSNTEHVRCIKRERSPVAKSGARDATRRG